MKGSDNILRALTTKNRDYLKINESHLVEFASQGLRNFNIGYRIICFGKVFDVFQSKLARRESRTK